ncbi:MAG: RluA family pseudouridine synthase [Desulfofustis sp.]
MAQDCYTTSRSKAGRTFIPQILYEDNHLMIVNKPAGMLTQGDASGTVSLLEHLKHYLKVRDRKTGNVYLGMVQRLDKPVSGVIVFAKTSKAAARISAQIRERLLTKCYLAVTAAGPDRGLVMADGWRRITHCLRRVGAVSVVVEGDAAAQKGSLHLKTLLVGKQRGFHAVQLVTGRKHQIRVQLAALGMPICGDGAYGSAIPPPGGRILLHSYLVRLVHPTRKTNLEVTSAPPEEFYAAFTVEERNFIQEALGELRC